MKAIDAEPRPIRWTAEEFWRLYEAGLFVGRRVELIGGEIVERAPQLNFHSFGIKFMEDALNGAFGPNYWVRVQMSLDLSPHSSLADPDLAVIAGSARSHHQASPSRNVPTTALLVVEVSETTLAYDRGRKMSLYAASGIADYWILNVPDQQLEVHRDPVADASQPFGFRYDQVTVLGAGDVVSPLALPAAQIPVADLIV
jgi:Uma2 family endonuclease